MTRKECASAPKGIELFYVCLTVLVLNVLLDNLVANMLRLHLFQLSTFPYGWTCVQSQVMVILPNQIRHQWLHCTNIKTNIVVVYFLLFRLFVTMHSSRTFFCSSLSYISFFFFAKSLVVSSNGYRFTLSLLDWAELMDSLCCCC